MDNKFQYRLVKAHKDPKQTVYEKAGITAEFTILEVDGMQERNRKALLEAEGQIKVEKAKMANIEHFHPIVKTLTPEQLVAAALYQDAQRMIMEAEPTAEALKEAIKLNDAMLTTVSALAITKPVKDAKKNRSNTKE